MASMSSLTDPFNGTVLNTALWTGTVGGTTTLTYSAAGAVVTFPATTTTSDTGEVESVAAYDLTGSYALMEVLAAPATGTAADAELRLIGATTTNYLRWIKEGTTFAAQYSLAGTKTNVGTSLTWNAVTYKWWRIRESAGTIYWDTAPDGVTWTNQASVADTTVSAIGITALNAYIGALTWEVETSPGTFSWNSFNPVTGTNTAAAWGVSEDTTAVAGTGSWTNPANAEGAPDSAYATWTAP
jgi:hypothetical protein